MAVTREQLRFCRYPCSPLFGSMCLTKRADDSPHCFVFVIDSGLVPSFFCPHLFSPWSLVQCPLQVNYIRIVYLFRVPDPIGGGGYVVPPSFNKYQYRGFEHLEMARFYPTSLKHLNLVLIFI